MANTADITYTDGLHGRSTIYTSNDTITAENVVNEVNTALTFHVKNLMDEDYLYWYRRNVTPILGRQKERNTFINNKVQENHADEIVTFKNGYFLTQPAFYVTRGEVEQGKVDTLNEYLYRSGKHQADNELVDWFHTVGRAALYVAPTPDKEVPVVAYALDPRQAFVVYSMSPGNEPVFGVNMVVAGNKCYFDVFTKDKVFKLVGGSVGTITSVHQPVSTTATSVISEEINVLGEVPIIEYSYNSINMGAFESVISLLDTIDRVQSNRVDGIEQFIQSIIVTYNCEFEDAVTADDIRSMGIVPLKSTADSKGDIKILSEQLDQEQTQVLVDYLYEQVLNICAMPSIARNTTSTSDTGTATLARNGWYQADASARNTADLFVKSNKRFDRIFLKILQTKNLTDLSLSDFELMIVRNETANIQSKAQSFTTLMTGGLSPELAMAKSGISNDPIADYSQSEKWIKLRWGDPDAPTATAQEESPDSANGVSSVFEREAMRTQRFKADEE